MLPDIVDTDVKPLVLSHLTELREALELSPEPDEEHSSALGTLKRGELLQQELSSEIMCKTTDAKQKQPLC